MQMLYSNLVVGISKEVNMREYDVPEMKIIESQETDVITSSVTLDEDETEIIPYIW